MKKVIVLNVLMLMFVFSVMAQGQKTKPVTPAKKEPVKEAPPQTNSGLSAKNILGEHFARKYAVSSRWNDFEVSKDALYDLIVEYPNNDSLIFALAYFYYENQKYASSVLVGQDLLARTPKNAQVLELVAMGYENLNLYDRALQNYESLFLVTNSSSTLYKMTALQYETKRYAECIANADILLSRPEADSIKVVFNDKENKSKEYPIRAALFNLKGVSYRDQSDKVNARKFFEESLKASADFVPAKENLAALK